MTLSEFEAFVDKERLPLIRWLYHAFGHWEDCEDISQIAFVRVWRRMNDIDNGIKSYLYKTAYRLWLTFMRKKRNWLVLMDLELTDKISSHHDEIEQLIETIAGQEQVDLIFKNMTDKQRECWKLYIDGRKYTEISKALQIPLGTVKSRINYGRSMMKRVS